MRIILITFILIVNLSHPLFAKIASVIGNPLSQEIYFEVNKDTKNYPASLTKIMTLYIIFDELEQKKLNLNDRVYFSKHATYQQPSKLGIAEKDFITVDELIDSLINSNLANWEKKFKNIKFANIKYTDLFLSKIKNKKILIDSSSCSIYFENILKKNNKISEFLDPIYFLKSIKSKIEIKNTIKSHIYDGAALTKFLFWLKKNYRKQNVNEISAQEKLLKFRKENKNFKFLSFPTISGSGPNGAIIHYKASKKSNRKLKKGDIYLVDSGGQYNFGTTDVTRTISLNNSNKRIKDIFTRVLRGHIAVASYKLKNNTKIKNDLNIIP